MNVLQSYRDGLLLRRQFWQRILRHRHSDRGRYEKPRLTAKWVRSYHESDPAAIDLRFSRAAPCHSGYVATCALAKPLHTCLWAQSNRGASLVAPSGPKNWSHFVQRNVYACALGKLHGFHIGHAIGTVNLSNCATRQISIPLKVVGTIQRSQSVGSVSYTHLTLPTSDLV